ncbi:hypothetical protein D3C78_1538070 [compost metagenome]
MYAKPAFISACPSACTNNEPIGVHSTVQALRMNAQATVWQPLHILNRSRLLQYGYAKLPARCFQSHHQLRSIYMTLSRRIYAGYC